LTVNGETVYISGMPDDPYSIADLARLSGVTPRTVRYYVSQGLLPSPEHAGPSTRYGEGHLARLRLIRRLQQEHLPLAEIRGRLALLNDDEVERLSAARAEGPVEPTPARALSFVQELMAQSGVQPRVAMAHDVPLARASAVYEPRIPDGYPQPSLPSSAPAAPSLPAMPPREPRSPGVDRSTWERHALSPDVELHVRRPLDRRSNKRVEQLIRIARELFDDEA
jgi:DNA-binding transcriptional MerR regulator